MRIVIDIRLLASGKLSGIEEYTRHAVRHILKEDRVNEYALFYNSLRGKLPEAAKEFDPALIRCYRIPNKLFDAAIRFASFPKLDALVPADIIFSPHLNIAARSRGVKRVMTVHDLSFRHHPEYFSLRKGFWHWLQDYERQIRDADRIIAVSDFTKRDIAESFAIPEEKITRIYSGIDPALRRLVPDDEGLVRFRRERGLDRPYLLFLGAFEPRKNAVAVVRAFNAVKDTPAFRDYRLVLAGAPGWLSQEMDAEISRSRYRGDIMQMRDISEQERLYLYNAASVFLYPSFFEGFGFPPLEAQACGIPVIASNRSSLPEILGNSALLADPWRIDDIVFALKEIEVNASLRNRLIAAGRENAKRFSWEQAAKEMISVFNHV